VYYVGWDLHRDYSQVAAVDGRGKLRCQVRIANDPESLLKFVQSLRGPVRVAVEATRNWEWLHELLEPVVEEVVLSHPKKTKAIASARIKTDKLDAKTLAHLLRTDLLPTCYLPDRDTRLLRELLRYRASLVRLRARIKNKVHALLAKQGKRSPYADAFGKAGRRFLRATPLPPIRRRAVDDYLELIDAIEGKLERVSAEVDARAQADPQAMLLCTIPGIGHYSALLILAEAGDISRFPTAKQLCSYAGLVPSLRASGDRAHYGRITKEGSPWLRWALCEAAQRAGRQSGPIGRFYRRIARRRGNSIAKVATARYLLTIIYHMLTRGEAYHHEVSER
jgi:transposase